MCVTLEVSPHGRGLGTKLGMSNVIFLVSGVIRLVFYVICLVFGVICRVFGVIFLVFGGVFFFAFYVWWWGFLCSKCLGALSRIAFVSGCYFLAFGDVWCTGLRFSGGGDVGLQGSCATCGSWGVEI